MKIPANVEKMIDKREKLAEQLNNVDVELSQWMEDKGMDLLEMTDFTRSGCMIYCEPGAAANCVREAINNHELN